MYDIIIKNKKFLLITNGFIVLIGLILCFVLPQKFTSYGSFIKTENGNSLSKTFNSLNLLFPGRNMELTMEDIVSTRWVMDRVIEKEDFMKYYDLKIPEEAYATYRKNLKLEDKMDGMYIIGYTDKDPKKAADVCNMIMFTIDEFYRYKDSVSASDYLEFLDKMLKDVKSDVEKTKKQIVKISKESGITLDPKSVSDLVTSVNQGLRDSIVQKEMVYRYYKQKNPSSPITKDYENEMKTLYKEWDDIYTKGITTNKRNPILTPLGKIPEAMVDLMNLQAELEIKMEVYSLLSNEYYSNLFKVKKESHNIQIIDKAVPPNKRSFPKRKILLLGFIFLALIWDVIFIQYKLGYNDSKKV